MKCIWGRGDRRGEQIWKNKLLVVEKNAYFVLNKDKANVIYRKTVGVSGAFVFLLDT